MVDRAAANVLRQKFAAGLFEHPLTNVSAISKIIDSPVHRVLARR
jgi:hypothetical protein